MRSRLSLCNFLVITAAFLAGCGGSNTAHDPNTPLTTRSRYKDLEFTLTMPKTVFVPGEAITWTFIAKNVGSKPITLWYTGHPVWWSAVNQTGFNSLAGFGTVGADGNVVLAPGESLTDTARSRWMQKMPFIDAAQGIYEQRQVASGQYTLGAWLDCSYDETSVPEVPLTPHPTFKMKALSPPPINFTIQ